MDTESGKCTVVRYKSSEPACVDEVGVVTGVGVQRLEQGETCLLHGCINR